MGIARAALIIMLGNVASRLLGVVREQVIAGLFGLTDAADAFSAASRVTTPIYDLLIGGMISAALIPVFSSYARREDEPELWRLVSIVLNLIIFLFAIFVVLLIIFAPQLMMVFGYGFNVEKQAQAVALVRIMLVSLTFMGCSGVLTAVYYSRHRFGLPALLGSAYNIGIAAMAILFHERMGVTSLAIGTLVGAALQVSVLLPGLRAMGMRYTLRVSLSHPSVRRIISLYLPVAAGLLVSTAAVTLDTNLASRTGVGSLTAMRFATTLIQLPLGLVAVAMGFAILPTLSRYASGFSNGGSGSVPAMPAHNAGEDRTALDGEASLASFKGTLALGVKMMLIAIVPATVGLVVLRTPLIQLLFQHGVFTANDTERTALAFLCYSPGLPAAGLDQLLIFSFYARRNTITPVLVGVFGILVYLVVALALLEPLGMPGLALANSAQWISHALVMLILLWRGVGSLSG
ncbi:MAG: murein biosynthesis integral membrane protein MurJ, partial [Chloroflexota bacterium]